MKNKTTERLNIPMPDDFSPEEIASVERLVAFWKKNPGALEDFQDALGYGLKGYIPHAKRREMEREAEYRAELERVETILQAERDQKEQNGN